MMIDIIEHGIKFYMNKTTRTWEVVLEDVPVLLNLLKPLPSIIDLPTSMHQKIFKNITAHFRHLDCCHEVIRVKNMDNLKTLRKEVIIALLSVTKGI